MMNICLFLGTGYLEESSLRRLEVRTTVEGKIDNEHEFAVKQTVEFVKCLVNHIEKEQKKKQDLPNKDCCKKSIGESYNFCHECGRSLNVDKRKYIEESLWNIYNGTMDNLGYIWQDMIDDGWEIHSRDHVQGNITYFDVSSFERFIQNAIWGQSNEDDSLEDFVYIENVTYKYT